MAVRVLGSFSGRLVAVGGRLCCRDTVQRSPSILQSFVARTLCSGPSHGHIAPHTGGHGGWTSHLQAWSSQRSTPALKPSMLVPMRIQNLSTVAVPALSCSRSLLQPATSPCFQPVRTRVRFSRADGKPRTVKAVTRRFFRLGSGIWIRTRSGRHRHRWRKSKKRVALAQQHLMCTKSQCRMLDRMVNKHYKMPKYYVDDPYAPYHSKKNLPEYNVYQPKFLP